MENTVILGDFRERIAEVPADAIFISDPPYNQGYHYAEYGDAIPTDEYAELIRSAFHGRKSVVIGYPEEQVNVFAPMLGPIDQCVSWVYNSNTAKQSRLVTWRGCRPDLRKVGQPYKNPTDRRIAARIAEGKTARLYDW
jgi:hypothetical protein